MEECDFNRDYMIIKTVLKHAYLIMAHNNFTTLEILLELLDHEDNDIYVHIDKKSKSTFKEDINLSRFSSKIFFVDSLDVKWGHYSQVECELELLKTATNKKYDYYHLLSGMDLPIKSRKYIQDFFTENFGKEFVHFDNEQIEDRYRERAKYFYLLQPFMRISKVSFLNTVVYYLNRILVLIQKVFRVNRNSNVRIQKGANWFSITHELADYVLGKEEWIGKTFRYTANPDELFLQTIVENSRFKERLYNDSFDNSYIACMRFINWSRGNPYTWTINDYEELINSKYLFARKFDEKIDNRIIEKIKESFIM